VSTVSEHEDEPVRGLPEALPEGERILWQGAPRWQAVARHVFHAGALAVYFGVMVAWRAGAVLADGGSIGEAIRAMLWLAPLVAAALAIVGLIAWLAARTTMYTITNRRVAMRVGVVLTVTFNLPFRVIDAAELRLHHDGTGDIALALGGSDRIAYLHLWPHARPWRFGRPQPMLRAVPYASHVAEILSRAVAAAPGPAAVRPVPQAANEPEAAATQSPPLVAAR